jgi:diguanylate cyclase (GGDEF)-like protein
LRFWRLVRDFWANVGPVLPDATPADVQEEMQHLQWERMVRQMPILNLLNMIFTLAVIYACYVGAMPPIYLILPALLFLLLLHRTLLWRTRRETSVTSSEIPLNIKRSTRWATTLTAAASLWSVFAFYDVHVQGQTVIPIFIALSALVAANCLASLPRAAGHVLAAGIMPSSLAFLGSGEPMLMAMAVGLMFAGVLQLQLVAENHRQWIDTVLLGQQLRDLANTDALTGLCNRRAFTTQFEAAFDASGPSMASGRQFGIAILDLDDFKPVNDHYGHIAGDRLLQVVAQRLTQQPVPDALVSRLGGDEFAVLFRNVADKPALAARATAMLASLSSPADIGEAVVPIPASIGYALFPEDGTSPHVLMLAADQAMYQAKAEGKRRAAGAPERRAVA